MSCLITESLPHEITIDGEAYAIDTDFRTWIKFGEILKNVKYNPVQTAAEAIMLCIKSKQLPPKADITLNALLKFYSMGFVQNEPERKSGSEHGKSVYDFVYDAKYIFAAFFSQYGIDLTEANMHWFKFCALFQGLSEDEKISKIIGYRSTKLSDIKDRKQKAFIRKMQELHRLPDNRSEEEKNQDMISVLDRMM